MDVSFTAPFLLSLFLSRYAKFGVPGAEHFSYFPASGSKTRTLFISIGIVFHSIALCFSFFLFLLVDFFISTHLNDCQWHRTQTRENNKHPELLERIHQLECKEAIILKESHELREQNELLEFRIIELEEGADKVNI